MKTIGVFIIFTRFAILDAAERVNPYTAIPGYSDPCMIHLADFDGYNSYLPFPDKSMTALRQEHCSDFAFDAEFGQTNKHTNFKIHDGNITLNGVALGRCIKNAWYIFKSINGSLYRYEVLEYDPSHKAFRQMANFSIAQEYNQIQFFYGTEIDIMFECDNVPLMPSEVVLNSTQVIKWVDFDYNREGSEEVQKAPDGFGIQLNDNVEVNLFFWDENRLLFIQIDIDTRDIFGEVMFSYYDKKRTSHHEEARYYSGHTTIELRLRPINLIVRTNGTVTGNFSYIGADPTRTVSYHNVRLELDNIDKDSLAIINFYNVTTSEYVYCKWRCYAFLVDMGLIIALCGVHFQVIDSLYHYNTAPLGGAYCTEDQPTVHDENVDEDPEKHQQSDTRSSRNGC
ncbi:hypothetical protein CAPTEDRAFT_199725 [Capitella teleta]|uniref:Farnesoic acid O-methyl transferase domain-containing protein n=1 Tax=Capitella teleta TaxID=283909 RepID=R7V2B1_CAPTE|nr:hypothetical protein CAPTEDRAFT_199725 [Capitella teleta]|eukprot:ELU12993.1 hypothetical protein CAPTEDRAFT_199725 [Capitella teleta]